MILRDAVISKDRYQLGGHSVAPEPPPARATLTLADVSAWLVNQNDVVRRACAALLAEDLEDLRAAAQRDGYAQGQAAAGREVEARHSEAITQLVDVARALESAVDQATEGLANDCAAIVAEAFTKIAGKKLVTGTAALGAVRAVIGRLRDGRHYTIHLHPKALASVEAVREELRAALGGVQLELVADPALQYGGCRVESEFGALDAAFDVQLRSLFALLQTAHRQQTEAG
jgi:flagellar assembly protein FliH